MPLLYVVDDAGLSAQASAWQEAFKQVVLEQDKGSDQQLRGKTPAAPSSSPQSGRS
jgi:hypothetical protein